MVESNRIERRLKLHDVRVLMSVVQAGSMHKAAERLATSQPAVSRAIGNLEHALGVRLLDRSPSGIEPTQYGRAIIKRGVAVFDELRQGVKDIEFLANPTAGELRIGCSEAMAAGPLLAVIDRLTRRHPRTAFDVVTGSIATLYCDLRERNVELIMGRMPTLIPDEDIDAEILFHEKLHIVAGLQNDWIRRRRIALPELVNEPWCLLPADSIPGSLIADAFRSGGLEVPSASVTCLSFQLFASMLATGRYLSVFPSSVLHFVAKRLGFRALPIQLNQQRPWPVAICTLKKRTVSPVAQLFIDRARSLAKPLANAN
jgi:DNA-binding transcriptional LysR family regulator